MTAKIRSAIRSNPALKTFQISVSTNDGMVTLTGAVDSRPSIARATEFVQDRNSLENRLSVKDRRTACRLPLTQCCN